MINSETILEYFNTVNLEVFFLMGSMLFLGFSAVLSLRMTRKLNAEYLKVKSIRNDLKAFSITAISVGKRVIQIERRQRELAKSTHSNIQTITHVETVDNTYEEAAAIARHGNDVETIKKRCGLSHSEAELIFLMNRLDKVG